MKTLLAATLSSALLVAGPAFAQYGQDFSDDDGANEQAAPAQQPLAQAEPDAIQAPPTAAPAKPPPPPPANPPPRRPSRPPPRRMVHPRPGNRAMTTDSSHR